MANYKKTENTNTESLNKDNELLQIIEEKEKELLGLKNELKDVNNKFDSLEKMILAMQNQNIINTTVVEKQPTARFNDDTVKIGSCLIGRHFLCDNTGSEIIELEDVGDVSSISTRLLDSLMTSRNKNLFKEGLVYFLDDVWYDRYSIKKNVVLDENTIDRIYKLPVGDMIKEINKITNEGKNEKVKYCLYWAIVKNITNGREGYNDKNKEITIGSLFNVDINNSIGQLSYAKEVGFL